MPCCTTFEVSGLFARESLLRSVGLRVLSTSLFGVSFKVLDAIWYRAYLNPEDPTFLGFLIMISLYKFLKR